MSEKRLEVFNRRQANETFSVEPVQTEIDERLTAPVHDTFSAKEIRRLGEIANKALQRTHQDDAYGAEVFVPIAVDKRLYIYDTKVKTEPGTPPRVTMEGATLYGYVREFTVDALPDNGRLALSAVFEKYDDDITEASHSYLIPMAIEGANYGVRLVDAPSPVGENDSEVPTQDMLDIDKEDIEQDTIHSLLNIIENDLFNEDTLDLEVLEDSLESLRSAGFIERLDDMTTACNYYLQKCLHDLDPWLLQPDDVMVRIDDNGHYDKKTGERQGYELWVSDKLTVVGIAIHDSGRDDKHQDIRCTVYARSDDNILYRRPANRDESLVLFRESDTESGNDE